MSPLSRLCALAAVCGLLPFPSHSEHAREPVMLGTVTVKAEAEDASLTSPPPEMAEEAIKQTPGGVDLVPSEEFRESRVVTVKDMLDFTPGVFAQSRTQEESRLSIRGSGLSRTFHLRGLKLLQDGVPINLADGSADNQDIDPLALRYVEVYKGANALRYGAATLGGAINFVTPTGRDEDTAFASLRGEAGSFGSWRTQVNSGQVIGDSDYYASLSHLNSEGFRDHSDLHSTRFNANLGQRLSARAETRLYITQGDINLELPGALTKAQLEADPRQANPGNLAGNQQRDYTVTRIANKTSWVGEKMELQGGVHAMLKHLHHPIFQLIDQDSVDYGAFWQGTFFGKLDGLANELTLGANFARGRVDAQQFVNLAGGQGARTNDTVNRSQNIELYGENRFYATDALSLVAGAQATYANRDYEDQFLADGDRSGSRDYLGVSPKLGLLYEPSGELQFFANLSRAYEPPTFSELTQSIPGVTGLADIDAQKSTTAEIGTRGRQGRYHWDASLYRAMLDDELFSYSLGGGTTAVTNAGRTIHQGIELGLDADLAYGMLENGDLLQLRTAYTLNDFRFDGDAQWGDNRIPGIPEQYLRAELRYGHPDGYYLAPNVEIVPEGYAVDMGNTLYTDPYALLSFRGGYDFDERLSAFIDARNLLDKTYTATTGIITVPTAFNQAQFFPGDGRAIYAGLTLRW